MRGGQSETSSVDSRASLGWGQVGTPTVPVGNHGFWFDGDKELPRRWPAAGVFSAKSPALPSAPHRPCRESAMDATSHKGRKRDNRKTCEKTFSRRRARVDALPVGARAARRRRDDHPPQPSYGSQQDRSARAVGWDGYCLLA
jgi:hypothetical protein